MPKVKWGGDITPEAIDEAASEGRKDYAGPIPPNGIYRFKLKWSKKDKAKESGKPKLTSLLLLDGEWKEEHAKYDGCPFWDHMPVQKSTAFRVARYCDALNITSSDFMSKMVVDEDGVVQKIGKLKIADEDLLVHLKVVRKAADGEYAEKLDFGKNGGYLPFREDSDDDDADDDDTDADLDDDSEPAF